MYIDGMNTRQEGARGSQVLGGDEVEKEQADAKKRLPQAQAVGVDEIATLDRGGVHAAVAERLHQQAEEQDRAVSGVGAPRGFVAEGDKQGEEFRPE